MSYSATLDSFVIHSRDIERQLKAIVTAFPLGIIQINIYGHIRGSQFAP